MLSGIVGSSYSPSNFTDSEPTSPVVPNYPRLSDSKGLTFRKKSFFYDPKFKLTTHTTGKPPYSYATLITYAISECSNQKLSLNQIYHWLESHYPYLKQASKGWKNSVRHNLSHNPAFIKVPRPNGEPGKGSLWTIDQHMLKQLTCNTLNYASIPSTDYQKSSPPNQSPISNNDTSFVVPPPSAFARRATISHIYPSIPKHSITTISEPQFSLLRRNSQPVCPSMPNYSISSLYQGTDFASPSHPYTYSNSYMAYTNSLATSQLNELAGNRSEIPMNSFGMVPNYEYPPSEVNYPYSNLGDSSIDQTFVIPSNTTSSINEVPAQSLGYVTNSNSFSYPENYPYDLLMTTESNNCYDMKDTSISPQLILNSNLSGPNLTTHNSIEPVN